MPIYKADGKKDGLQKYNVRVNYVFNGTKKQLTKVAYGIDNAKDLEWKLNHEVRNKENIVVKMTVKQLFDKYIASKSLGIKKSSILKAINNFDYYIFPTFENIYIHKITTEMIENWKLEIDKRKRKLAINTKRSAFMDFKAIMNYAVNLKYIPQSPFNNIKNFKDNETIKQDMNYYTMEEYKLFIDSAKNFAKNKEKYQNDLSEWNYYVFFALAFFTGARKGEIHALKWSDINDSCLSIKRSINQRLNIETTPKTKKSIRNLQMPLPLIDILKKHKKRQERLKIFNDDFRICNNIKDTTLQRKCELYSKSAGLKTIRIHDFRHSHVSALAHGKINIQEIARRLGHSKVEMTWNTYCHLYPYEEEKAITIFNSLT